VETFTQGMEELKRLIVNKHSQRRHKMLPTRGLEYDEELPSPTHTTAINSLKEFASGLCQAWNNQTHPYH